jgi:hypothetical protein
MFIEFDVLPGQSGAFVNVHVLGHLSRYSDCSPEKMLRVKDFNPTVK